MMGNNPSNMVTVVAKEDICILTTSGAISIKAGQEARIKKSDYARCVEPRLLVAGQRCEPLEWLITIPAGEAWKTEVPKNGDGTPRVLLVSSASPLAYAVGTASKPLELAQGAEIKENAPVLLMASQSHTIALVEDGEQVESIAFENCSTEDAKVQLVWEGC